MKCSTCNGKGKVINFVFYGQEHYKKCSTCKGAGRVTFRNGLGMILRRVI